jgi:hypothetical protein
VPSWQAAMIFFEKFYSLCFCGAAFDARSRIIGMRGGRKPMVL